MEDNPKLRVKEICKERGWTLKQLAEKMSVAPETLTRAISNNANPTLATLQNISRALDINIQDIFSIINNVSTINGYLEVNGEVFTIRNVNDLERVCKHITEANSFSKE